MRTQSETGKTTKWVHPAQGKVGTFVIEGELEGARRAAEKRHGPVLALVGKRFPATAANGGQLSLVFTTKR